MMTAYTAISSGNWNATTGVWSPDGSYPGQNQANDTVDISTYTIALNVSPAFKLASITVSSGRITVALADARTLLCGTISGGTDTVYGTLHVTGASGSFQVGNISNLCTITGGGTDHVSLKNAGTGGTVTVYGFINGGTASGGYGLTNGVSGGSQVVVLYGGALATTSASAITNGGVMEVYDVSGGTNTITGAAGNYGIDNNADLTIGTVTTGMALHGGVGATAAGVRNQSGAGRTVNMTGGTITGGSADLSRGLFNASDEASSVITSVTITGGSYATAYGLHNTGTIQLITCTEVDMTAPAVYNTGTLISDIADISVVVATVTVPDIFAIPEAQASATISPVVASVTIPSITPLYFGPATAEVSVIVASVSVQMATAQFGFFQPQWMWPNFRTRHARRRADRMTAIARRNTIRV